MLKKIFFSLSIITTIVISFVIRLNSWYDFYIPILIFIGTYFGYIALYFLFIWIISLTINTKKEYDKPNRFYQSITILTMELLINLAHVRLTVKGNDLVPSNKKYMFVYNHCSNYDPIIQSFIFRKHNLIHISKPENFKIPIAGPFIKRDGYLAIDRDNDRSSLKTIVKAIHLIESQTASIGVSPEGKRNFNGGLLPFRPGCFKIALKAKCPIVIATMRNTTQIHKNFPFKATPVEMRIIKVLDYEDIKDLSTNEISQIVRKYICEDLGIIEEPLSEVVTDSVPDGEEQSA